MSPVPRLARWAMAQVMQPHLSHLSKGRLRRWSSTLHAEHATGEGIHQAEGCARALHHVKADPCCAAGVEELCRPHGAQVGVKEQVHSNIASLLPGVLGGSLILQACRTVVTTWCQVRMKQWNRVLQQRCHQVALLGAQAAGIRYCVDRRELRWNSRLTVGLLTADMPRLGNGSLQPCGSITPRSLPRWHEVTWQCCHQASFCWGLILQAFRPLRWPHGVA